MTLPNIDDLIQLEKTIIEKYKDIDCLEKIQTDYKVLGAGCTRVVLKPKYSRYVLKLTTLKDAGFNRAEYAIYKGLEGNPLQKLFCPVRYITPKGLVMVQDYMSTRIPYKWSKSLFPIEKAILSSLSFCSKLCLSTERETAILDLHSENTRLARNRQIKIIDYACLIYPITVVKGFKLDEAIKKIKRMRKGKPLKLFLDPSNNVRLSGLGMDVIMNDGKQIYE